MVSLSAWPSLKPSLKVAVQNKITDNSLKGKKEDRVESYMQSDFPFFEEL